MLLLKPMLILSIIHFLATEVIMALPLSTTPWESVMLKPMLILSIIHFLATEVIMAMPLSTTLWESVMLKPMLILSIIHFLATVVIMALPLPTIPWKSVMLMLNRKFPTYMELQAIMATMAMLSLVATRDMNETDTDL